MYRKSFLLLLMLIFAFVSITAEGEGAYMGVNLDVSKAPLGVLLTKVIEDSPAARAGLIDGDIILEMSGNGFGKDVSKIMENFRTQVGKLNPGDKSVLKVFRRTISHTLLVNGEKIETDDPQGEYQKRLKTAKKGDKIELESTPIEKTLELTITFGSRGGSLPPIPPNEELGGIDSKNSDYRKFINNIVSEAGLEEQYKDLFTRIKATHEHPDFFRKQFMANHHRDPFALTGLLHKTKKSYFNLSESRNFLKAMMQKTMNDPVIKCPKEFPGEVSGVSAEKHIENIARVFNAAEVERKKAFSALSEEEMQFIVNNREGLIDVFVEHIYIDSDTDKTRRSKNLKLLKLAEKIDYQALVLANAIINSLSTPEYLEALHKDLLEEYRDVLDKPIIASFETPLGPIIIGGTGSKWYAKHHYAMIIDLGGDDFYSGNSGSGSFPEVVYVKNKEGKEDKLKAMALPFGVVIDFAGNDAYESTRRWEIGSGSLGCGLLIDVKGNDQYISIQCGQASAFMGCGTLIDMAGDDVYRGRELCQAAAFFGTAFLFDNAGNDRYEGNQFCQSLSGAGSTTCLLDMEGDDEYYSKGSKPTNYGDPGIFDAWSQGCGIGFRGLCSGGIALFADTDGCDRYEAGNFSQGGGYYFGMGLFIDLGQDNDLYIGSRYNQGFSAHQAVGAFYEDGGDDHYITRQAVAQGLAWDECVTIFIDAEGDDVYDGGTGFSQGASAHNSFCLFHDISGTDTYNYNAGQARAGGNTYHGGSSLSLFLDTGGTEDIYTAITSKNNEIRVFNEYGIFADLPCSLEKILNDDTWIRILAIDVKKKK